MKTLKPKLILIAVVMIFTIITMVTSVDAKNERIEMITKDGEYIIYINGYERTSFKFTFSNEKLTEEEANEQLNFMSSADSNGQKVAYLNDTMDVYSSTTIYFYAKTLEGTAILTAEPLDKSTALSSETLNQIENLTKNIAVETENTTQTIEDVDGVTTTKSFGQIDIVEEDTGAIYYYQIISLDGTESENAKTLMQIIKNLDATLDNADDSMKMCTKIATMKQINEKFMNLIDEAKWSKVSNMQIIQPLTTADKEQYIVLIQKEEKEKQEIVYDVQFLTSEREDSEKYEPEIEEREVKVSLPVTYDSIILFVILAVIIVILAFVFIRIKMLEKKENEKQ